MPLTSCLTCLDHSVLQIKTQIVSWQTADSKPVKQDVNSTVTLPSLVFPEISIILVLTNQMFHFQKTVHGIEQNYTELNKFMWKLKNYTVWSKKVFSILFKIGHFQSFKFHLRPNCKDEWNCEEIKIEKAQYRNSLS